MLEPGSAAPALALQDTDGNTVDLAAYRGRAVLLYFLRSTTCPICNRHVRLLAEHRDGLAGAVVFAVVPEDRATALKAKARIPFPILTGAAGSPHESIGLTRRLFGSMQQSGTVLIDADGIVRHVQAATVPTASLDWPRLKSDLAALVAAR
jgi:peroxiredoxin